MDQLQGAELPQLDSHHQESKRLSTKPPDFWGVPGPWVCSCTRGHPPAFEQKFCGSLRFANAISPGSMRIRFWLLPSPFCFPCRWVLSNRPRIFGGRILTPVCWSHSLLSSAFQRNRCLDIRSPRSPRHTPQIICSAGTYSLFLKGPCTQSCEASPSTNLGAWQPSIHGVMIAALIAWFFMDGLWKDAALRT